MKHTIKDLAEGRCAAYDDTADVNDVLRVLKAAFPNDHSIPFFDNMYYYKSTLIGGRWSPTKKPTLPVQNISEFLKELDREEWKPKFGERIWVWNNRANKEKRIFLAYIPQTVVPFVTVDSSFEEEFDKGEGVATNRWQSAAPIEEDSYEVKVTKNGEEVKPCDVPKKVWKELRKPKGEE